MLSTASNNSGWYEYKIPVTQNKVATILYRVVNTPRGYAAINEMFPTIPSPSPRPSKKVGASPLPQVPTRSTKRENEYIELVTYNLFEDDILSSHSTSGDDDDGVSIDDILRGIDMPDVA